MYGKDFFRYEPGQTKPGYLTTSELKNELGIEPEGSERFRELAAEAMRRARVRAFPWNRVPESAITNSGRYEERKANGG